MAIADYYKRSAVAIAQVVAGFDEKSIRKRLDGISIELVLSPGDAHKPEALSALDLSVRLAARLYPKIAVTAPTSIRKRFNELASRINPNIGTDNDKPTHSVVIGKDGRPSAPVVPPPVSGTCTSSPTSDSMT